MKIAVIGANSYIARNLIHYLAKSKPVVEMRLYGRADKQVDGAESYRCIDILDEVSIRNIDLDCDVVFMFVGKTGTANGFDNCKSFVEINELALLNLLNEYRRQDSQARIVFPSTRLVYRGADKPLKEDAEKETKSIYACIKLACERYLALYHDVFGVRYCILRICLPYGTLVPDASSYGTVDMFVTTASKRETLKLYGQGHQRRTLTWIGDLCKALVVAGESENCENDVFNVGGEDYSVREIAEMIAQKYGTSIRYVPWPELTKKMESGSTVFNSEKLDAIIGNCTAHKFMDWIGL